MKKIQICITGITLDFKIYILQFAAEDIYFKTINNCNVSKLLAGTLRIIITPYTLL